MTATKPDRWDELARFMTETKDPDTKSKLTCKEQMEFLTAWLNIGKEPGLEFFKEEAEQDLRLMMSLSLTKEQHPRTDDIVEMFKAITEEENREWGTRPVEEYKRGKRDEQ